MIVHAILAVLNGLVVGTSRAVNGRLGNDIGPLKASLWNHVVGFAFLTIVVVAVGEWAFDPRGLPTAAYLGGCFGALFVAINSYLFPRLGAVNAALFVIGGQMISAVLIDWATRGAVPSAGPCLGVILILVGVHLSRTQVKGKP